MIRVGARIALFFATFQLAAFSMCISPRSPWRPFAWAAWLVLCAAGLATAGDANRFRQLDGNEPYMVGLNSARLTTPAWVGEPGVEAVVVLAIDDMRGPEKWEAYLRPILDRLKKIDGRAPVSIMTCQVDPAHPHLQKWLAEGLSLEVHTIDHPCPLLKDGDLAKARSTYDRCVDLMASVPGNNPMAFRMPCCDSLNTLSPRFFSEIFGRRTELGHFLQIDSSVFTMLTPDDPALPRELVELPDGTERFRRYVPFPSFANLIENYPYPYVINGACWEMPCIVPSDWEAQHVQKPANPRTLTDLQAALDAVVVKQGVFNFVFHPYDWIRPEQVVGLIDYAVAKHGGKVKFLNFREVLERMTNHALAGQALRGIDGGDNGVRLLDLDDDGHLDVVIGNREKQLTRLWSPAEQAWRETPFPTQFVGGDSAAATEAGPGRFGVIGFVNELSPETVLLCAGNSSPSVWHWNDDAWRPAEELLSRLPPDVQGALAKTGVAGARLADIDGDGSCELVIAGPELQGAFAWHAEERRWTKLPWEIPTGAMFAAATGQDGGLRLVDVDDDGTLDLLFSHERAFGLHLFTDRQTGWSIEALAGTRPAADALPLISRNGTDNGAWFLRRTMWLQNEDTARLPDLVERRSFHDLLAGTQTRPRSPAQAQATMHARPGFVVELAAAEPLVADPVAFDWGPDGRLWVVEMADYPLGVGPQGQPGGRLRVLADSDGDGRYDRAEVLANDLHFPGSVKTWRDGALVISSPDILFLADRDGDGRAEVREVLYTGLAESNPQHRASGFTYGLDNWLYCGNGAGNLRSVKTGQDETLMGRDFRIRPDQGLLDPQAGHTQFVRAMDDWGTWFGNNNIEPLFQFVLADHYQRRNPHFAPPHDATPVPEQSGSAQVYPLSRTLDRYNDLHTANRFTSACGTTIYRDDLFGPGYEGNSFAPEPVHNLVHREVLRREGLLYRSRRAEDEARREFLATGDNWSRPTFARTGPDGALWVADMYRAIIEHPEWIPPDRLVGVDVRAGSDRGRIYRLYPQGKRPRPLSRLDRMTTAALAAALDHPNGWQRDKAQEMLVQHRDAAAAGPLRSVLQKSPRPQARLHALCSLEGLGQVQAADVLAALDDPHPGVRRHAVRIAEPLLAGAGPVAAKLVALVDDPDPWVRLQLAYSLGELNDPEAGRALARLLRRDAQQEFIVAAAFSSALPQLAVIAAEYVAAGPVDGPAAPVMGQLLDLALAAENEPALFEILQAVAAAPDGRFVPWQVAALARLLDRFAQRQVGWDTFQSQLTAKNPGMAAGLVRLRHAARALALSGDAKLDDRLPALGVLGREPAEQAADVDVLVALLAPQNPRELHEAAIARLGALNVPEVASRMLGQWRTAGPELRGRLLDLLLARESGAQALLDGVTAGLPQPAEIGAAHRQRLIEHRRREIRQRAADIFAAGAATGRDEVVRHHTAVLQLSGDAVRGEQLFQRRCAVCHRFREQGQAVGPDLSAVTDKSPQALLVAMLDPNRAVEARFVSYTAQTNDGRTFNGLLSAETTTSVTLLEQEGKQHVLLRTDLEALETAGRSLMPEGLERDLSDQDLADVMAYVLSYTPIPKTFAGNRPAPVHPDPLRAEFSCLPSNAAIFGASLVFEEANANLGYWVGEDDVARWDLEVTRAGMYEVILEWACPDELAGNSWLLEVGAERLGGNVAGTGDWQNYRRQSIGRVRLTPGRVTVGLRSNGPIRQALWDVKSLTLRPRGE